MLCQSCEFACIIFFLTRRSYLNELILAGGRKVVMSTNRPVHEGSISRIEVDNAMSNYFTGRVEIKKMVSDVQSKEVEMFLVSFFKGARTKLHFHESDQILLATEGSGQVAVQTRVKQTGTDSFNVDLSPVRQLRPGDFVLIPAGQWHLHGAIQGSDFAHFQVKKPGRTTWLEQ